MNIDTILKSDKLLHLLAGFFVAALVYPLSIIAVIPAVVVVAGLKELRDALGHGTPDVWDFVATVAGGLALLLYYLALGV